MCFTNPMALIQMAIQLLLVFLLSGLTHPIEVPLEDDYVYCSMQIKGNRNPFVLARSLLDEKSNRSCTYVNGFIEVFLEFELFDSGIIRQVLSQLNHIRVVTGYVAVAISPSEPIVFSMTQLRAVYGRQLYPEGDETNFALVIMRGNQNLVGFDFRNLKVIANGNVGFVENAELCHSSVALHWEELFDRPSQQKVVETRHLLQQVCQNRQLSKCKQCASCEEHTAFDWFQAILFESQICSQSCAVVDGVGQDLRKFCYGPKRDQCQWRNKCQSEKTTTTTWCFMDLHRDKEQACHSECIGGCWCHGPNACYACRNYFYNQTCVEVCPENTLILDKLCVHQCPENHEVNGILCAPKGLGENSFEKRCALLDEEKNHLELTKDRIKSLCNCEVLNGSIILTLNSFRVWQENKPIDSVRYFDCLKSIHAISGIVKLDFIGAPAAIQESPDLESLFFLQNLDSIMGAYKGAMKEPAFTLANSNVKHLNLMSLRFIGGAVFLYKNVQLFNPNSVNWAALGATKVVIRPPVDVAANALCNSKCLESLGCWGCDFNQCVTCSHGSVIRQDLCGNSSLILLD